VKIASILALLLVLSPRPGGDEEPPPPSGAAPPPPAWQGPSEADRAGRDALERGLSWLALQVSREDGCLAMGDADQWAPVGVTSLGALALMAGGSSPGRGPHGAEVERVIRYLLDHADLSPESTRHGYIALRLGDPLSRTHGHGFATLAIAQAYGMSPGTTEYFERPITAERLERVLTAAVRLIESSQGAEGGWYYEPEVSANHEGSVTVCLVQALRAARNSGIKVDREVIHKAEDYVLRLQKDDGTFRYQLDMDRSSVALTAAGIGTLNMAGRYDDSVIQSGIDAIWNLMALRREEGKTTDYPFYERFYLAQALWQLTDRSLFDRWFAEERTRLLKSQRRDGSWECRRYGDAYATAMNCLVLAIPEGLLPIFQR